MTKLALNLVLGLSLVGLTVSAASASQLPASRSAVAPASATRTLAGDDDKKDEKADKSKKDKKKKSGDAPPSGGW